MNDIVRMKRALAYAGGSFVLSAFAAGFLAQAISASPPAADGATVFQRRCQSCHALAPGKPSIGPNLAGVVGRKAASADFNYSEALKHSGLTWDRATLSRYLASPRHLVPGTRMTVSLPDEQQRAALISYLTKSR